MLEHKKRRWLRRDDVDMHFSAWSLCLAEPFCPPLAVPRTLVSLRRVIKHTQLGLKCSRRQAGEPAHRNAAACLTRA